MRLDAGGVVEDVVVDDVGTVSVTYSRAGDGGWLAEFVVRSTDVADLAVVHRLVAPTLHEARLAVPSAAAFLAGKPIEPAAPLG